MNSDVLILNKLKNWRNDLAKKIGKPSYYILSNQDLIEVISKRPQKIHDFLELKGWGRKKTEKYAQDILAIINHQNNRENSEPVPSNNSETAEANFLKLNKKSDIDPIFSVSEFIEAANAIIKRLGKVKIKGEISAVNGTDRGYAFFDLRDSQNEECLIKCIMFRRDFQYFSHFIEEGSKVIIQGNGNIYPKNGSLRVIAEKIEPIGEGEYKKSLEKLKQKLFQQGYFGLKRKKALPFFIKKIGLVTSFHGAAIHDFQKNIGQCGFQIFFKNVYVEGDYAEQSIIEAINFFNKNKPDLDIIVLIRGGGSWESLKAFNNEKIIEAIITSRLPVVTGIGHESDETIAGLSSDKDCSTPTAVANFLRNLRDRLKEALTESKNNLIYFQEKRLQKIDDHLILTSSNLQRMADSIFNKLEYLREKLTNLIQNKETFISRKEDKLREYKIRFVQAIDSKINHIEKVIEMAQIKIENVNPNHILQKGYSVVFDENGKAVKNVAVLKVDQKIKINFYKGRAEAKIKDIFNKFIN